MSKILLATIFLFVGAMALSACGGDSHDDADHDSSEQHADHDHSEHAEGDEHADHDDDHGVADAATLAAAGITNTKCPIMGDPIDPKYTTKFMGKKIGFCCEDCLPKWEKLSDAEKTKKLGS